MTAALIILGALVAVGGVLYIHYRLSGGDEDSAGAESAASEAASADSPCCGMHITCEKDSLLSGLDTEILYYDDEELDSYQGRRSDEYTEEETEQFRDVLLTLLPTDIAGWARSLQQRNIALPEAVREELLLIVAEERARKQS